MNIKNRKIVLFISLSMLIILMIGLLTDKLVLFDKIIYDFIIGFKSPMMTILNKWITFFASVYWFLIIIILFLSYSFWQKKILYSFIVMGLSLNVIFNWFLKNIFRRLRPSILMLVVEGGYSFPSGHSASAMFFYGIIIYSLYRSHLSKKIKCLGISFFSLLIFLIGLSRIYLGVHFPSDVLAGFMVGLINVIIMIMCLEKYYYRQNIKGGKYEKSNLN